MNFEKIKGWQIALVGCIFQFIHEIQEIINSNYLCTRIGIGATKCQQLSNYSTIDTLNGFIQFIPIWGLLITAYLYIAKEGKGGDKSIIVGYILTIFTKSTIVGVFLILAGIHTNTHTITDTIKTISNIKRKNIKSYHITYMLSLLAFIIGSFNYYGYRTCSGACDMAPLGALLGLKLLIIAIILYITTLILKKRIIKNK